MRRLCAVMLMCRWGALAVASLCIATACAQEEPPEAVPAGRLRAIRVVNEDVFDRGTSNALEALVNALHWQTRESVIRRELWFEPGDRIDARTAAEFERNLRALGLFAEARVRLVPTGVPDEYDLVVETRDRLSLNFGAGASYVGGVGGLRGSVGESNFLGLGDRVALAYAGNSENEYRGSLNYTDLHLFDTWHTAAIQLARTDEGDSISLGVARPFKHLRDTRAYGANISHIEADTEYYRLGESVAEVPVTRDTFVADIAWGTGPREDRLRLGVDLELQRRSYGAARGLSASEFRVPGETTTAFFGPTVKLQHIGGFRKVEGLDTIGYVQDLRLGTDLAFGVGARWRDEQGVGAQVQPELRLAAGWTTEPVDGVFVNARSAVAARWHGDAPAGWNTTLTGRVFALLDDRQTVGIGCTFDAVEETQDLPAELTLGEDNGLRGYRARLFAGTRRVVANVEHRYDTGIELLTLRFGTVLFFDAGQVGRGGDYGGTFTSAGIGLRVGSPRLFGRNVLRVDVAKPLDRVAGESDGWTVSVTVGQVFTFDG